MREIDPFSYYPGQASAVPGFGGDLPPPDAQYCFHTDYITVRPGLACYQLRIAGVRASRGRLALRVHSHRRDSAENAKFVAGAQIDLDGRDGQDLCVGVQFVALPQTQYAFYGQFVKDADIRADALTVSLGEGQGHDEAYVEPPPSVLAPPQEVQDLMPAKALLHVLSHPLVAPVSQDCTLRQMAELRADAAAGHGLDDWGEALCLNALRVHGATGRALEGLLVGPCSDRFAAALGEGGHDLLACPATPPPPENSTIFGDFMVWPQGVEQGGDPASRWHAVKAWYARLKIGGIGIITCRFVPGTPAAKAGAPGDGAAITRSEIERWARRLIAEEYSVDPLVFSTYEDLALDEDGQSRFALVARRV